MNRTICARVEPRITRAAGGYRLEAAQFLPRAAEQIFELFADAFQLQALTPPWLHFSILAPAPARIEEGVLINYRLRVHGLPIRWQSRILAWEPPRRFVDEQTHGPYRRWRHEHLLEPVEGGTLCHDIVEYSVYGGALVHALLVRRDLLSIFRFRQAKLSELFPLDAIADADIPFPRR